MVARGWRRFWRRFEGDGPRITIQRRTDRVGSRKSGQIGIVVIMTINWSTARLTWYMSFPNRSVMQSRSPK